jgi:hypothetical protein
MDNEVATTMDGVAAQKTPATDPQAFLIQEFNALRKEIEMEIKQLRDYLQYAILASGGIWAWFLSHSQLQIIQTAYFLPFALSLLLCAQTIVLRKKIFKLGSYIAAIECRFNLPDGLGWETQLVTGRIKRDWVPLVEMLIWAALCLGNFGAAFFIRHGH